MADQRSAVLAKTCRKMPFDPKQATPGSIIIEATLLSGQVETRKS